MVNQIESKSKSTVKDYNQRKTWKYKNFNKKQWKESKSNDQQAGKAEEKGKNTEWINCNRCGLNHVYRNCPAHGKSCNNCKGYHHYAKMCVKKRQFNENNYMKKIQEIRVENVE